MGKIRPLLLLALVATSALAPCAAAHEDDSVLCITHEPQDPNAPRWECDVEVIIHRWQLMRDCPPDPSANCG